MQTAKRLAVVITVDQYRDRRLYTAPHVTHDGQYVVDALQSQGYLVSLCSSRPKSPELDCTTPNALALLRAMALRTKCMDPPVTEVLVYFAGSVCVDEDLGSTHLLFTDYCPDSTCPAEVSIAGIHALFANFPDFLFVVDAPYAYTVSREGGLGALRRGPAALVAQGSRVVWRSGALGTPGLATLALARLLLTTGPLPVLGHGDVVQAVMALDSNLDGSPTSSQRMQGLGTGMVAEPVIAGVPPGTQGTFQLECLLPPEGDLRLPEVCDNGQNPTQTKPYPRWSFASRAAVSLKCIPKSQLLSRTVSQASKVYISHSFFCFCSPTQLVPRSLAALFQTPPFVRAVPMSKQHLVPSIFAPGILAVHFSIGPTVCVLSATLILRCMMFIFRVKLIGAYYAPWFSEQYAMSFRM